MYTDVWRLEHIVCNSTVGHGPCTGYPTCSPKKNYFGYIGTGPSSIDTDTEVCGVTYDQLPYWWDTGRYGEPDMDMQGWASAVRDYIQRNWYFKVYRMQYGNWRIDNGQVVFCREKALQSRTARWYTVPKPLFDAVPGTVRDWHSYQYKLERSYDQMKYAFEPFVADVSASVLTKRFDEKYLTFR